MLITEHFNPKYALPLTLQFSRLAIYLWERPLPTNFLNLSDSQKTWKQRQDALEQESDTDDGADDWHEFSGVRTDYGRLSSNAFPMERCIASTFVNRAKRAFRAGQSWQQFENSELAIDSEGQARAEIDLRRRRLLLENALDNTLQLAVFDTIKQRLCEEIWLQAYQETATPAAVDTPNPSANTNSGASTWTTRIPMRPTPEESERGITGWLPNRYGDLEPLYEDETEIPGIGVRGRGRISENAGRVNGREGQ